MRNEDSLTNQLLDKISRRNEDELHETMWINQSHYQPTIFKVSKKKINNLYSKILSKISERDEFMEYIFWVWEVYYNRFEAEVSKDVEQFFLDKNSAKPWLTSSIFLKQFNSFAHFVEADYDIDPYEDLLDEIEKNYVVFKEDTQHENNLLISLINQTLEEIEEKLKMKLKHSDLPKKECLELMNLKFLRMLK